MPEHVLLNALGGRTTVRDILCPRCNHEMGIGPDAALAKSTEFIRSICDFRAGDGGRAAMITGLSQGDTRFDLAPGMRARPRAPKPLDVTIDENGISVSIEAYSEKEADRLVTGAATKIAKHLGHTDARVIEAIKQDLLKDKRTQYKPAPPIKQQSDFGCDASQRSMAKACLVLWAKLCGNVEVNGERFDAIRAFIRRATRGPDDTDFITLDTRAHPEAPAEFSRHPIFIWVGSDADGKVYGYFRLYGAVGWRFRLCSAGGRPDQSLCLVSNPFDNRVYDILKGAENFVDPTWIWEMAAATEIDGAVMRQLSELVALATERAHERWSTDLVEETFGGIDDKDGELSREQVDTFVKRFTAAVLARHLQTAIDIDDV